MFNNFNFKIMNPNVKITAVKKEFKNGTKGFEVRVDGMDGKVNCLMNFHNPLKAMRYMFMLSKRLELQIDNVQLLALSLAYQRVKVAEQQIVDNANEILSEMEKVGGEPEVAPESTDVAVDQTEAPAESPMIKQYRELKEKHPEALLLFRCGDFYETYFDDAVDAANILGITLTRRSADNTAMAGFPYHALDTYLPKLIRSGKRVAICDQLEDNTKNPVKRNITELVKPASAEPAPKKRGRKPKAAVEQQLSLENEV